METPLSDKGHKSVLHKMVSSSPVLDTLTDYEAACKHLATGTPEHSIVQEIQKSGSSSASLQALLSILALKEGDVDALWAEKCRKSAHFEAAAKVLENTFERLEILSGCGELLWVGHFLAALTLGGHSLESDKISIDGDVLLQGARAIPATPSGKFVRPDQCIGVPKVCISPEWQALCAGKAILPLDIMEYKRDTAITKITKHCYKLLYAAIVCAYHQLDLHDAVMSEPPAPSQFSAAIPLTLATIMHGNHFHMTCVWYAKGVGLRWGVLYDRRINNVLELKRCFLLRHEAINIVIRFGELLRSFDLTSKRSPRRDVWWRRFCVCGTKDNEERYVQCSTCLNWFHPKCVELTKIPRGDVPWHCPAHPPKLQAEAEPRENHGSRDGGGGTATIASSSLHPEPIRQLFKNSKSEVWLCQSAVNGREQQVVLKLVDTRERAMEEARILKQLRGVPNVAQLLDVIHHSPPNGPSRLGLVMEYYPSSDDWISSAQLRSDRTFGRYTRQLLQAVNDIHERGVVHYDISPSNVMFTTGAQHGGEEEEEEEGSTVLLDFGSALAEQPRGARWYQRSNWGTTGFVAPEVVAFGKCSHKIDVWSAGALIAFQLLGVWPRTNKETETVAQMTFDQVKAWAQNNPQRWWPSAPTPYLTPSRWELVRRMLALHPAQRLDASSALEQFDALWSRPSPAAGKQDSPTSK